MEDLLDQRRERQDDLSKLVSYADDMRAVLEASRLAEQKAFIKRLVKEVVVENKKHAVLPLHLTAAARGWRPQRGRNITLPRQVLASATAS